MNRPTSVPNWNDYRSHLDQISKAALAAINPEHIIRSCLSVKGDSLLVFDSAFPLRPSSKVFVVGAGKAGYGMAQAIVVTTMMQGEAAKVGRVIAALLKCLRQTTLEGKKPTCLIFGGETTVTVQGEGQGGRNQETALAAALEFSYIESLALMTLATDGVDGSTPAAGAIVTGGTISKVQENRLDAIEFLANNDSHTFFDELGDTIITGPTGTNVNDLVFGLVY